MRIPQFLHLLQHSQKNCERPEPNASGQMYTQLDTTRAKSLSGVVAVRTVRASLN